MTRVSLRQSTLLLATAAVVALAGPAVARDGHAMGLQGGDRAAMILERFDANGDGQVTEAEVAEARAARFETADADGDGKLSPEEIAAMVDKMRAGMRGSRLERMIARHDTDGDGLMSAEEMEAVATPRIFERLDADEDGVITEEEIAEAWQMRRGHERGARGMGHGGGHGHGHRN